MINYTAVELDEALCAINSIIHKCEKAQEKFPKGSSHHTLLQNRLKALYISKALITEAIAKKPNHLTDENTGADLLLSNLNKLQTTNLGIDRIKRNLHLDVDDVVGWCKEKIQSPNSLITRKGKNWYIIVNGCEITVNATSFTVITAHKYNAQVCR